MPVPTMADSPIRAELIAAKDGFVPIGIGVVQFNEKNENAIALATGLTSLKKIDYCWGFQDNALMSVTRMNVPGTRTGILALFDQPTFSAEDLPPLPGNLTGFTAMALAPAQAYGSISKLASALNPDGGTAARRDRSTRQGANSAEVKGRHSRPSRAESRFLYRP